MNSSSSEPQTPSQAPAQGPAPGTLLTNLKHDIPASIVVFLVALPLCLGIALASGAPLMSGLVAGIVGGLVVGSLSGSHTSVAGPAAGLAAIVAVEITHLGSFEAFLVATVLAGVLQLGLGLARAGSIAAFFPSSVIKGLLTAIGVLLILKQIPHLFGHDPDPVGEMAFDQPDEKTTFTELFDTLFHIHPGATAVGLLSLVVLVGWGKIPPLKKSLVPVPLVVVVGAVLLSLSFGGMGETWVIGADHLVRVPEASNASEMLGLLQFPDWSALSNSAVYMAAITLAIVASLETLLNLEAVDKLDKFQRQSPPNRELLAQGAGNIVAGLIGGLPLTSVIVRSSVNVNSGGRTRASAIIHGGLLVVSLLALPWMLNMIPLATLAAILIVTGFKLASPALVKQMWSEGKSQFVPYVTTVVAIVATDLLKGIIVGLAVSVGFILYSNLKRPMRLIREKHVTGDVLRVELANQVSFLNRASLDNVLASVPSGGRVLLDARSTAYIDPDILDLIFDFKNKTAPARGVELSLLGFRERYALEDDIQFVDFSSREVQTALTPERVLGIFKEGNMRFRNGQRLTRDLIKQVKATAHGQNPMGVVLSCIDSRAPVEHVFDLGIGDIFSIRIAGNVARDKVLGSMEYACKVAGAKLILVLGHTSCGAVTTALDLLHRHETAAQATGCQHIDSLVTEIQKAVDPSLEPKLTSPPDPEHVHLVTKDNVRRTMRVVMERSDALREMVQTGAVALVGGLYDVNSGAVEFFAAEDSASDEVVEAMHRRDSELLASGEVAY